MKVAVLGAAGGIGQALALLLKLQLPAESELSLYDIAPVTPGVAKDVSHIPTAVKVEGFAGEDPTPALKGADVVLISAGVARKPGMDRSDLFNINAGIVRNLIEHVAKTCPKACVGIITNPVNTTVAIAAEVLKKVMVKVYDVLKDKAKKIESNEEISQVASISAGDEEIGKLKAEIEEWKNEYLRKQADFQNFTKRKEKEVDELKKFASEKIITQFLGSLDNLERAIESSIESKDFDSLLKGIEMIVRKVKDIMSAEGVEEIKTEGVYDPVYHHAVGVEANEDFKEDEIVKVLQKGYMMKGKVIRPAMVIVCKK